uniref:Sulfotransferase n=1 Tax=Latimeria chalumnae TaxID=7897 RepID=H3A295_LATCH
SSPSKVEDVGPMMEFSRPKLVPIHGIPIVSYFAENWDNVKVFQARPDDLLLATFPKAVFLFLSYPLIVLLNGNDDRIPCEPTTTRRMIAYMCIPPPPTPGTEQLSQMDSPRVIKTHLPFQLVPKSFWEQDCKVRKQVIYMARNAKDNAVSYYHFGRMNKLDPEPGTWPQFLGKFIAGNVTFGSWFDHVKGWWDKKDSHRILYLFYEDLKEDLRREIHKLMAFLEKDLEEEVVDKIVHHTSFEVMKENPMANYTSMPSVFLDQKVSPFMRKGTVGDWKNYFTVAQSEMFDKVYREKMAGTKLTFRTQI